MTHIRSNFSLGLHLEHSDDTLLMPSLTTVPANSQVAITPKDNADRASFVAAVEKLKATAVQSMTKIGRISDQRIRNGVSESIVNVIEFHARVLGSNSLDWAGLNSVKGVMESLLKKSGLWSSVSADNASSVNIVNNNGGSDVITRLTSILGTPLKEHSSSSSSLLSNSNSASPSSIRVDEALKRLEERSRGIGLSEGPVSSQEVEAALSALSNITETSLELEMKEEKEKGKGKEVKAKVKPQQAQQKQQKQQPSVDKRKSQTTKYAAAAFGQAPDAKSLPMPDF